jgi:SAM-dependent methyltransferase
MSNNCSAQLNRWFQTSSLGRRLLSEEAAALQQILPHLFGYHLLQIGNIGHGCLLESSLIRHRCVSSSSRTANTINTICDPYSGVYALPDALPFATDCIDVVVLPHLLEFEKNPEDILREVERILIPEGHVVILGFNPMSVWGVWRWLFARRDSAPWCGQFLPLSRIKSYLAPLGFDLEKQQIFFFALPFFNKRFKNVLESLPWAGHFGAVYLLVAKKRVATLTPIKSKWLAQPTLVTDVVGTPIKEN